MAEGGHNVGAVLDLPEGGEVEAACGLIIKGVNNIRLATAATAMALRDHADLFRVMDETEEEAMMAHGAMEEIQETRRATCAYAGICQQYCCASERSTIQGTFPDVPGDFPGL